MVCRWMASKFASHRTFYVLPHNLLSTETSILDVADQASVTYTRGEITDEFREAARELSWESTRLAKPIYAIKRPHWWSNKSIMTCSDTSKSGDQTELAYWKHPGTSAGKAHITFPINSENGTHELALAPPNCLHRTNAWIQDSVQFEWQCDSKWKANRMTLHKTVTGRKLVVARYAQRWGSWVTGAVLIVDSRDVKGFVAVLTCCADLLCCVEEDAAAVSGTDAGH